MQSMMEGRSYRRRLGFVLPVAMATSLLATLGGCAGLVISAGATVAAAAAEERGVKAAANDLAIAAAITALWIKNDPDLVTDLDVTVSEGRALLTGTVTKQNRRLEAVRLAWRVSGITTVINEIEVRGSEGITGYTRDGWITAQLVSRLSFDLKVQNINYTIETVNRIVYLMGIAQNQAEIDRVKSHARRVRYVRRVVSHVLLKTDPRRKSGRKSTRDKGRQG
jgi:osmotically-inducible protein OsmY